jgi:glycerol-3-phosphate dehydrogenase (NAD(P)+)
MPTPAKVTILGAGPWGTAFGSLVAPLTRTTIWARRPEVAAELGARHGLTATADLEEAVARADVLAVAVPANEFREVLERAAAHLGPWVPILSLVKGIEGGTNLRMTEIADILLPGHPAGVLAGPALAGEVAAGQPADAVVAFAEGAVAQTLQSLFSSRVLRVRASADIVGCELAGPLAGVHGVAAGLVAGLAGGEAAQPALITRGLDGPARFAAAAGADPRTATGPAGVGDLVAACTSPLSPWRRLGLSIARDGASSERAVQALHAAAGLAGLASEHGVGLSVVTELVAVLRGKRPPEDAFADLRPEVADPALAHAA